MVGTVLHTQALRFAASQLALNPGAILWAATRLRQANPSCCQGAGVTSRAQCAALQAAGEEGSFVAAAMAPGGATPDMLDNSLSWHLHSALAAAGLWVSPEAPPAEVCLLKLCKSAKVMHTQHRSKPHSTGLSQCVTRYAASLPVLAPAQRPGCCRPVGQP